MRPRVHRYLADRLRAVSHDLMQFPSETKLPGYEKACQLAHDRLMEAVKHQTRAEIFKRRGDRQRAARSWRQYRRAQRGAETLLQCAKVLLAFEETGDHE